MHIEFIAPSPKAGTQDHVSREVGITLIAAGFAKEVAAPEFNVRAKDPLFEIVVSKSTEHKGAVLRAICPKCGRTDTYPGRPGKENIESNFLNFLCVHFRGMAVPDDIVKAYGAAYVPDGWATRGSNTPTA